MRITTMLDYEFMRNTVIATAFVFIIMLDIWGIGNMIVTFVKWIWKKTHKAKDEPADTAEATEE